MSDEFPAEVRDTVPADTHFLADPDAPVASRPVATGYFTCETLDTAIDQLMSARVPDPDSPEILAEIALSRWLDKQPPGTAEGLLRRMYGGAEDGDD